MNKSGADMNSMLTQVDAGIDDISDTTPAKIAPTIPPMSKTIESSALCSDESGAERNKLLI